MVSIVHACIIWIGKLTPVPCWNTEQALYYLEEHQINPVFILKPSQRMEINKQNPSAIYLKCINKHWTRALNVILSQRSSSLYPWLSVCVMQDGHRVWVGNSVTHKSRAKHPGQVVHVHLSLHTLRDPGKREGWNITHSLDYTKS